MTLDDLAEILAEKLKAAEAERLWGDISLHFRNGQVILIKTIKTEVMDAADGGTDHGKRKDLHDRDCRARDV